MERRSSVSLPTLELKIPSLPPLPQNGGELKKDGNQNNAILVNKRESVETLEANRVKSALEHRRMVYKELNTFEQVMLYHRQWLEQPPITRQSLGTPDPTTLDSRGDDLPLDKLHALATQSQVKDVQIKAAAAMEGDRNLLHVDRYVYWYDTKAPPAEWSDIIKPLLSLHEVSSGFVIVDLGLAPMSRSEGVGFTWLTGFVDEKWSDYVKYALDATMECSTYMIDPAPWLVREDVGKADGADRLVRVTNDIREFARFPSEEPAVVLRNFMQPINPKLLQHMAEKTMLLTVVDHIPGRRDWLPKLLAKVLRNRNKMANPTSKSKGLNYYIPAIKGLRKERDEKQRLHFVKGIHNSTLGSKISIKELLQMPLNELRVKYWTFQTNNPIQQQQQQQQPIQTIIPTAIPVPTIPTPLAAQPPIMAMPAPAPAVAEPAANSTQ